MEKERVNRIANKKAYFWSLIFIIFIILTIMFAVRTIHKYDIWKGHEEYLRSDNKTIQEWMPVNLISKRSGITNDIIYSEIGIEESFTNNRKPLFQLCQENNLNCTQLVDRLNRLEFL
jgi:hypothetical protein